jgi:hypothetical protein
MVQIGEMMTLTQSNGKWPIVNKLLSKNYSKTKKTLILRIIKLQ